MKSERERIQERKSVPVADFQLLLQHLLGEATRLSVKFSCPVLSNGMDSWPTSTKARTTDQKRKGKQKRTTKGLSLHFEAGAVTAATLQQNDGRLVWASVSKNIKGTV